MPRSRLWVWIRWHYRWVRAALSRAVDRALGLRTTFVEPTGPLEAEDEKQTRVRPCGWLTLYRAFRSLQIGPEDVLLDLGAGAGRAVLIASLFPFWRVIGVERLEAMHRLAQENLARCRPRRSAPVELVLADATEFAVSDDITAVFLYNPFSGETFQRALGNVFASLDRVPRRCRLVYVNPVEHEYLLATGRCRLLRMSRGLRPTGAWARSLATYVYELGPEPAPASAGAVRGTPEAGRLGQTAMIASRAMRESPASVEANTGAD